MFRASDINQKCNKMHNRNRVINKLALVLICIVVLELVLIGHQVQPVKGIKKKIYLKKLKKLLPLFALVKPKKKIILLPVSCLRNCDIYKRYFKCQLVTYNIKILILSFL